MYGRVYALKRCALLKKLIFVKKYLLFVLIVPKIEYMNFENELKNKICVYLPSNCENESKLAVWYDYDLSNYLNDGLKRIKRLGSESQRIENLLIQNNNFAEIQSIKVTSPNYENITLLDVVAYTHFRKFDKNEYSFLEDWGDFILT